VDGVLAAFRIDDSSERPARFRANAFARGAEPGCDQSYNAGLATGAVDVDANRYSAEGAFVHNTFDEAVSDEKAPNSQNDEELRRRLAHRPQSYNEPLTDECARAQVASNSLFLNRFLLFRSFNGSSNGSSHGPHGL
jgi:hypothetical protein